MSEHQDKQVKPEQTEQKGVMSDVVLPVGQSLLTGGAAGWASAKFGGGQKQPPPNKDK
jgi:hypothetical protein